jgi:hypothetical protein
MYDSVIIPGEKFMNTSVLLDYHQRLSSIDINNDRNFISIYEEFLRDFSKFNVNAFDRIEESDFLYYAEFFTNCQKRYLSIHERESVKFLLETGKKGICSLRDLLVFPFVKNSYDRVRDLSMKIDFTRCHRAVMVGCGALPTTLFWLHDHYPAIDYIGLDVDAECVALASQAVSALNATGIQILNQDGAEYDFSGVDFIFVANQVTPKKAVLERIAVTSDIDAQVVVRNPINLGNLLAECIQNNLPPRFSVQHQGNVSQAFLSMNLFLN